MAEQDSYLSNVGPYPTAPDTSVDAFFRSNSQHDTPYWRRYLAADKTPGITTRSANDWAFIHQIYDSWANQLTNQYNADVKTWETAYASPLSQSELKEAAGINRNWMTGEYSTAPSQSEQVSPFNDAGNNSANPADLIFGTLQNIQGMVDGMLNMRMKAAQIENVEAQTYATESMLPFRMLGPYLKGIKSYNEIYGAPQDDITYLPITNKEGVTFTRIPQDSWYNSMLRLQKESLELKNSGSRLDNQQRRQVVNELFPIRKQIYQTQLDLLNGQLSIQNFNKKLREITQPHLEKYAPKSIQQEYISRWVNLAVDSTAKIGGLILDFKNFNKMLNFDLFKSDGDYSHLQGYE